MLAKIFKKRKKDKEELNNEEVVKDKKAKKMKSKSDDENTKEPLFKKNSIIDIIKPQGINPNPLDHMIVNNTVNTYTRTLYVKTIPTKSRFAYTFSNIFKYPNSNVAVYIDPIPTGRAISELNSQIISLDTERLEVVGKNRNRERYLTKKLQEAEQMADSIESGGNKMFNIAIFITLYASSLEDLDKASIDISNIARNTGISLSSCYQYNDKGFQVCTPSGKNTIGYWHPVDKNSIATLFHYTSSDFTHDKGAWLGTNLQNGRNVFYYLFDRSLNSYNLVVTGVSGSGKSTLVKKMLLDYVEMGIKVIGLDTDSSTDKGEYSLAAESVNGINIEINSNSNTILNPFDVDIEMVYDELTGREVRTLNLTEKILDATYILLTMARGIDNTGDINDITRQIIQDVVAEEYKSLEIYNNAPDSLYTTGQMLKDNTLTSGLVKKQMPTISSWYNSLCEKAKQNNNSTYAYHYDYLVMVMKDWVRDIGTRPYFDGQSTVKFDTSIPFINIDIHKLHESFEKPIAQVIVLSKMWEDYIKKNSENIHVAEKIIAVFDEVHLLLRYPEARKFLVNMYKRIRKKNGAVITSTQELVEFNKYDDTMSIITNAETKIIGKQDELLLGDIKKILQLTDSEALATTSFEETGMYLMKSKNDKVFFKSHLLDIERLAFETNRTIIDELKRKQRRERKKVV